MRTRLLGTTALAAFAMSLPAATPAVSQDLAFEDIVVTARKTEENLLDAPVAVSAFTERSFEELGLNDVDDIARFTPGLSFSKAFGRTTERPVIRGQGNILAGVQFGVESGTAYFVDGVYYSGDVQSIDLNEIQRVEVIKGPQSALYGRNTYAGAINYITKGAPDELEVNLKGILANKNEQDISARIAGPISDKVGFSLNGRYYNFGGDWRNAADNNNRIGQEKTTSVSGMLDFKPSDTFDARIRLNYTRDKDGIRPFALQKSNANNCFPGYRSNKYRAGADDNNFQYYCGTLKADVPANPTQNIGDTPYLGVDRKQFAGTLQANWDISESGWIASLQGGFRDQDLLTGSDSDHQDGLSPAFELPPGPPFFIPVFPPNANGLFNTAERQKTKDWSAELRIASPTDNSVRGIVGAFYYDQTKKANNINYFFNAGTTDGSIDSYTGPLASNSKTRNYAFFGLLAADITDQLTATGEIRYANEKKSVLAVGRWLQCFW